MVKCDKCERKIDTLNSTVCIHSPHFDRCDERLCYVCWYKRIEQADTEGIHVRCIHKKSCDLWVDDNYKTILNKALILLLSDEGVSNTFIYDILNKLKK